MIRSMTGFGSASVTDGGVTVSVEIRSLNNRFLDFRLRLPKQLEGLEDKMNSRLRQSCERGRITVAVSLEPSNGSVNGAPKLDRERFESYRDLTDQISREYSFDLKLTDLMDMRDLLVSQEPVEISDDTVLSVLDDALSQLNEMREKEGGTLATDIQSRVAKMDKILDKVRQTVEKNSKNLNQKYREKIEALLNSASVDESRIAMEAAVLAEKADVTEECVRCASHFEQIRNLVEGDEPAGKRLNFLLQEVVREINTIGSKSADLSVINYVVDLKEEAEKIKEQAQNIL